MSRGSTSIRGRHGETRAAAFLEDLGYRIVTRNYRCHLGEIDIVCRDGDTLVFVEVRTRESGRYGDAIATVTHAKQRRIARVAAMYLSRERPRVDSCRFDVVGITDGHIRHVRDAFRLG